MQAKFPQPDADLNPLLEDVAGYLNFSSGTSDVKFLRHLSSIFRAIEIWTAGGTSTDEAPSTVAIFSHWVAATIDRLEATGGPFADVSQARAILGLLQDSLLPAYRQFHCDLLYHQHESNLWRPFFVGRATEALLQQGPPWDETERIISDTIGQLNDFVGYRPVPTLESRPDSQPYAHEFVRPIPLFIRGAGVASGPYERIVTRALEILQDTDPDILARAWFDLDQLEEIALDPRAYDFDHPVNRRPNYHFGQWDPHQISGSGYYTRFVLQQLALDALLSRCQNCPPNVRSDECLDEAAAVLAGTILMASGTSGNAPDCHDSTVTLSTLLPLIAAYRDDFYEQLLGRIEGQHGRRLQEEAQHQRQSFGGARQHLNRELARRRAVQLQRVHLAHLFARMGYPDAALEQVNSVRVAAARMICKIYCHLTSGHDAIDNGQLENTVEHLAKIEELIHRAVECGALVDPWNVVGFAANFSLFPAMENTLHDWRVDELIELVEQVLDLAARAWSEAAAVDNEPLEKQFSSFLSQLATWWDQFATYAIEDVRPLMAKEVEVSANLVSGALNAWHKAGAAAGDIAFWRMFVDQFDTSKSFQMVIEALLDHGDTVAARALMMQWVSQKDRTPLEDGDNSFRPLAFRWLAEVESRENQSQTKSPDESQWEEVARFFVCLEAGAEEYWQAPSLMLDATGQPRLGSFHDDPIPFGSPEDSPDSDSSDSDSPDSDSSDSDSLPEGIDDYQYEYEYDELDEEDEENELYSAAYEKMSFRGSTDDGFEGEVLDDSVEFDPLHTEWEYEADRLEQRLDFLITVARLWKHASITWGVSRLAQDDRESLFDGWLKQAASNYGQLVDLLENLHRHRFAQPSGSHESLVEFDRLRTIKEMLIQLIITTCVETCDAARLLLASRDAKPEEVTTLFGGPIDGKTVQLLRAVLAGDAAAARLHWEDFLDTLRKKSLLYVPHSRGGKPRKIVAARVLQQLLHDLLGWLPQLGMIRETCQLLEVAQQMEVDHPVGRGAVTEFDRLFESGYQAIVRSMVASAKQWEQPEASQKDSLRVDHMLTDALQQLTEQLLVRWLAHSHTLRLSVVEKFADEEMWQQFIKFVERYGGDLFTQKFLSLGNLRGILHQGVGVWLKKLMQDPEAVENIRLIEELDANGLDAKGLDDEVAEMLVIAFEAVVENYRVYLDYNTTTTQSDHGEMLYTLIDFLRVRAAYDRVAWKLKPVVWAHEILVRQGRIAAAEMWCRALVERTTEAADLHWESMQAIVNQYGMQLATVSDRLSERFVRPLVIDRLCSLVEPAMTTGHAHRGEAFAALEREIASLASEPSGAGLDLPDWLASLEDEVTEARSRMCHQSSSARLARRIGQVQLSWHDLMEQLGDLA